MRAHRFLLAMCAAALSASAQIPDFTPPTPLIGAIMRSDTKEAVRLLDAGADANEGNFMGASPLLMALMEQNPAVVRALLKEGADAQAVDGAGSTTLMWAAAAESGDAALVEEMLRRGVDPNARNKMGETALTWAMRRGHTPAVEALKRGGASDAPMIREAVEKSLGLLQKSGTEFLKVSACTSCHNQSLPQMTYGLARERGFAVDAASTDKQKKMVIAMFRPLRESMLAGKENIPDPAVTVSYSLMGLAAEGYGADETTDAMAHIIAVKQTEDGSWPVVPFRPPIESNRVTATALSIRALQLYGKPADQERIPRALAWLRTASPQTNEERAMQLLGMAWAKSSPEEMRTAARALLGEQQQDGGWAQLPTLGSDAYATGQALVSLYTSGQLRPADRAYQRAITFLLRTQHADGSWLVRTRAFPLQPLKDSGFPHGRDQWISAAGTSWASMALLLTMPEGGQPQMSALF
jgi:hypothetical protein